MYGIRAVPSLGTPGTARWLNRFAGIPATFTKAKAESLAREYNNRYNNRPNIPGMYRAHPLPGDPAAVAKVYHVATRRTRHAIYVWRFLKTTLGRDANIAAAF